MTTSRKREPQVYFAGAAYGPRNAEAHAKALKWMRDHPKELALMIEREFAAFDRAHGIKPAKKTVAKRAASKRAG